VVDDSFGYTFTMQGFPQHVLPPWGNLVAQNTPGNIGDTQWGSVLTSKQDVNWETRDSTLNTPIFLNDPIESLVGVGTKGVLAGAYTAFKNPAAMELEVIAENTALRVAVGATIGGVVAAGGSVIATVLFGQLAEDLAMAAFDALNAQVRKTLNSMCDKTFPVAGQPINP